MIVLSVQRKNKEMNVSVPEAISTVAVTIVGIKRRRRRRKKRKKRDRNVTGTMIDDDLNQINNLNPYFIQFNEHNYWYRVYPKHN